MKIDVIKDYLVIDPALGRKRRIALAEVDSVEIVENHKKADLVVNVYGGEKTRLAGLGLDRARELADGIGRAIDPPEAIAEEALPLAEIGERLEAMSRRPGIRTSKVAGFILDQAARRRATDVHLEGGEGGARASIRIDGVLRELGAIGPELSDRLFTYLKVESGVASYRRDIVQEGSTRLECPGAENADIRISFVPTRGAEKAVIRIFGHDIEDLSLSVLGFNQETLGALGKLLDRPEGMILLTGPSASGKTTTLYAALKRLAGGPDGPSQVVSIEDPIEREVSGVTQVQVDVRREMSFDNLLGALLRQDADAIMVGEIRGVETAEIAVQAALTGHLILSTIHAGRAPEVIVRLLDLGLDPYRVASALAAAMSQRLLRTVCGRCGEDSAPPDELLREYERWVPEGAAYRRGAGCEDCYGSGYLGRTAVAELLEVGPAWQDLIAGKPTSQQAMEMALDSGMAPLYKDAVEKAAAGITTLEEVKKVLG